jgi:hypothetical protein
MFLLFKAFNISEIRLCLKGSRAQQSWHRFFGLPSFHERPEIVPKFQLATACFLCSPLLAIQYINSKPLLRRPVNWISKLGISQLTTKSKFCCLWLQSPTTTLTTLTAPLSYCPYENGRGAKPGDLLNKVILLLFLSSQIRSLLLFPRLSFLTYSFKCLSHHSVTHSGCKELFFFYFSEFLVSFNIF